MRSSHQRPGGRRPLPRALLVVLATSVALGTTGCWAGAGVSLSAADTIEAIGQQMQVALSEYHAEVEAGDDAKEAAAIAAFVTRLQSNANDDEATAAHVAAFEAAMVKLRADRRVEWQRHLDALDNVRLLDETSSGLRQVAIESLTLQDEIQRYVTDLIEARKKAVEETSKSQNVETSKP